MEAEAGVTGAEAAVTDLGAELAVTDLGAEVAVTDSAGEVLAVMVLARLAQVLADAALVRDLAGRMDLRVEVFLVGEIVVASVIAVSVGEIAAFAIVGFAISKGTFSILASMALDIQIITNTATRITTHTHTTTDTRITIHTRITTIGVDSAGGTTDHLNPVKWAQYRKKAMSTIIKFVAPADRLLQPADDKKSFAADPEIKFCEPSVMCKPGQRFWKLSARAASPKFAIIEISIPVLFLALALVGMVNCFTELSHLLHSDAVWRVAARAINGSV
jgi:hypothetical protein